MNTDKKLLTPRQSATVVAFEYVLGDTGFEFEYDDTSKYLELHKAISEYVKKYDKQQAILSIILAFDIEIDYDEAKDALEAQGSVHEAIVEICKIRDMGGI